MALENEMKNPKDFCGTTGVLNQSMIVIVALYSALGLFGYIKYGSGVQPTVTVNLPQGDM